MTILKVLLLALSLASTVTWSQTRARFTDLSLVDVLSYSEFYNTSGIIYTWSPRMILSIRGVSEIQQIASELNLDLTVLADPRLPDMELSGSARDVLLIHSMKADSQVLERLGISLHYPSLILYKNGKIDSIRPGYDEPVRVKEFILRRLR